MAIRNIVKFGDEVLNKKCRPVEKFDHKLAVLLDDMADTLYEADGVGLAAPQVGILRRVVIIDVGEGRIELINPEIIETSEEMQDGAEGCLYCVVRHRPVNGFFYNELRIVAYIHTILPCMLDLVYCSIFCGISKQNNKLTCNLAVR